MSDNVLFGIASVSHYVVNEGADNKLNSMDSVVVDIENVVICDCEFVMHIAYLKPGQHDLCLDVLGK